MRLSRLSSAAELFDAAMQPEREGEIAALGFDILARPGEPAPAHLEPDSGIIAIRRALGENRLAVMSPVSQIVGSRQRLEAEGVQCEGYGDGVFAEVGEWRGRRKALRIAGINRLLVNDMLLVRPRPPIPAQPPAKPGSRPERDGFTSFDFPPIELPRDARDEPIDDAPVPALEPTPVTGFDGTAVWPTMEIEPEAINDSIAVAKPPVALTASVGRAGRNDAADVTATQNRLVEQPTAAEFAAVSSARAAIGQSVSRGLTIKGPVGATPTGNAPDDVRAVQRRLVEIGRLSRSHVETPAAATTAAVPQASLPATISAIRALHPDVEFWQAKGRITGTSTTGIVKPGDATAALLNRIAVYSMTLGGEQISFRDHIATPHTRSESGVKFVGTASPSAISLADYNKVVGLSPGQAAALKQVATHEGSFDAINTYDRALVSVGFIQFAGSRGLPRYLALLKMRHPARFKALLQTYGIDVEFVVARGAIETSRLVVLEPEGNRVSRGTSAEAAVRDDMRLTTALILSGRDRDVQLTQIEAAVRDYVLPILGAPVTWTTTSRQRARLGDLFRSQKGMATLFDRCIQEGLGAARRRFERVIQNLLADPDTRKTPAPPPGQMQRREGDILAEVERDLQAAADVADKIGRARRLLATLIRETHAAGATVTGLLARPELSDARRAILEARVGVPAIVNVTVPAGIAVKAALDAMAATLEAERQRLALSPEPASVEALRGALTSSRQSLASAVAPVSTAPTFLARIQRIRRSTLDSGLGAAEAEAAVV